MKLTKREMMRLSDRKFIRDAVLKSGHKGLTFGSICRKAGRAETCVRNHVMALETAGEIEKTHTGGGQSCLWGAPGIREAWKLKPPTPAQLRYMSVLAKKMEPLPPRLEHLRRIVPASQAPKIHTKAPNSVWQLAA